MLAAVRPGPPDWEEFRRHRRCEIYWLRGLVPAEWAARQAPPVDGESEAYLAKVTQQGFSAQPHPTTDSKHIVCATDGSWGSRTRDKRAKVCSWSVFQAFVAASR